MAIRRNLIRGGGAPTQDFGGGPPDSPLGVFDTRRDLGGQPSGAVQELPMPDKGKEANPLDPHFSRFGETPRERPGSAPGQPMEPTPAGGAPAPASTGQGPFMPLPSPGTAKMALPGGTAAGPVQSQRRKLFGQSGGLLGGGLGVPLDPMSNDVSDPITSLIQLLLHGQGGGI